jgi:prepilin-type N-terminal cleavage/methylation domain-containing protein
MKKKGFTLIELLAVIVILAIIALIATPIILNMINNARKSAAVDSAYGYIEALETNNALAAMTPEKYTVIEDGENINIDDINVTIKGSYPDSGKLTITKGKVEKAELCINGYTVEYEDNKAEATKKCNETKVNINAGNVSFTPTNSNWKVNTVEEALDDLYK